VRVTPTGANSASLLLGGGVASGAAGPDLTLAGLNSTTGLLIDGGAPTNVPPDTGDILTYDGNGPVVITTQPTNPDAGTITSPGAIVVNYHDFEDFRMPPTANAGGHYTIREGDSVTFDGSGSADDSHNRDRRIVKYEWDLDNDGIYDEALDVSAIPPTVLVPWSTLAAAGISGVPIQHTIGLRVTNAYGLHGTATTVLNVLSIIAPASSVRGQFRTYMAGFIDPTNFPTHQATWDWGDGTTSPGTVTERGSNDYGLVTGSHIYTSCGDDIFSAAGRTYQITMTVTANGTAVFTLTKSVLIKPVDMQPDPVDPTKTALVVGGTTGDDTILFGHIGGPDEVQVAIHSVILGSYKPTGHLICYGQAGNDVIVVTPRTTLPAWVFGDDGNDQITGGGGRNLLVGGAGADRLTGGPDSDLLITGTTPYETDIAALAPIMAEWESADSYAQRTAAVVAALIPGQTVFIDNPLDTDTFSGSSLYFGPNRAPALVHLADQAMSHRQDTLTVSLSGSDPNGDPLSYSAAVLPVDPLAQQAYDLNQQLHLHYVPNIDNLHGSQEKWLQAAGGELYALLPNGDLRHWVGWMSLSPVVAQFSPLYYATPALLCDAQPPSAMLGSNDVTLSVQGNQLAIQPRAGTLGICRVNVAVSDGALSAADAFLLTVTNTAPVLASVSDQSISYRQGSLALTLSASDADGDPLSYAAALLPVDPLAQQAYDLSQQLHLHYVPNIDNLHGAQEKWLQAGNGELYALLPAGELRHWVGDIPLSPVIARFTSLYYASPALLCDAQPPGATLGSNDLTLTVQGNQLVIEPRAGALGSCQIQVSASDGVQTVARSFRFAVTNTAPVLARMSDQAMSHRQENVTLTLSASDADGDPLSYAAALLPSDPLAQQAYDLNQQLHLHYVPNIDNLHGAQEKWLQAANGELYALLPGGELRHWVGIMSLSPVVQQLSPVYYANPALLYNAQSPSTLLDSDDVTLTLQGNQLVIQPAAGAAGTCRVQVDASDGLQTVTQTFGVSVTGAAPTASMASGSSLADPQSADQVLTQLDVQKSSLLDIDDALAVHLSLASQSAWS